MEEANKIKKKQNQIIRTSVKSKMCSTRKKNCIEVYSTSTLFIR